MTRCRSSLVLFLVLGALPAGALAGCGVAALFLRETPDWRSLVLPYAFVAMGYAYTGAVYPTEPQWLLLLVPAAPLALWFCSVGPLARLTGVRATLVQAAFVIVPLIIIAALVRATAGGATLWIDYSRPAKRGRQIFGSTIVPWGEVWRTGANAATQFRTDKALDIGGVTLPAGFYTLWTIPSPQGGWKLLINSETGQWGTAHKPERDLYQLDMTTSALAQPVERFTISVVPSGQGGALQLDWDTTRATIPFTVRP